MRNSEIERGREKGEFGKEEAEGLGRWEAWNAASGP
jgi:hypothetical protein